MAVAGAIAEATRGQLPVTWDMLSTSRKFGDALLRRAIDGVKEEILGTVGTPESEDELPLSVIKYLGKLVALELITPGIDAWRSEPTSLVTTGTSEQTTYSDPVDGLLKLRELLLKQTRTDWANVAPLINFRRIQGGPRPAMNTLNDEFLTPSPQEFPRPYRVTERS
jgi:hypothetical protein